jgi:hypothetical protein
MKHTKLMAIVTMLLLGVSAAAAQSLGDYARAVRKNKAEPSSTSRHFDNDNLPTNEALSVVGPPPGAAANAGQKTAAVDSAAAAAAVAAARQKTADEWNDKIAKQKAKIDSLNHELDLDQREVRVRAAAWYTDPSISGRSIQWNKDDAQFRSDIDAKQKALDTARQQLDEMQSQAHKAGVAENPTDKDNNKSSDKDNNRDKE